MAYRIKWAAALGVSPPRAARFALWGGHPKTFRNPVHSVHHGGIPCQRSPIPAWTRITHSTLKKRARPVPASSSTPRTSSAWDGHVDKARGEDHALRFGGCRVPP
jgi:hypothetical protein